MDSQILNDIMACGRKFKLDKLDNWRPVQTPEAFEHGDLVHRMLAHYYRARMAKRTDWPTVIDECKQVARRAAVDMDITIAQAEEDMLVAIENLRFWHHDGWTPLIVEEPFSKVLYQREDTPEKEGMTLLWEGVIDLVIADPHGDRFVVDHKTAQRRQTPSMLSAQFMGYKWFTGYDVIVNKVGFQKSLAPKDKFQRHPLHYQRQHIQEWQESAIYWAHVAMSYIEKDYFPPNWTSCDKYSGCIYKSVCERIPETREFRLASFYFKGEPWSPYTRDKDSDHAGNRKALAEGESQEASPSLQEGEHRAQE